MSSLFLRKRGKKYCIYLEYKDILTTKNKQRKLGSFDTLEEAEDELHSLREKALEGKLDAEYDFLTREDILNNIAKVNKQLDDGCFVYRFLDSEYNILYVGSTIALRKRVRKHNHLPKECYDRTKHIEYFRVNNEADAKVYEVYLINKYRTPFNSEYNTGSIPTLKVDVPRWNVFNTETMNVWWL